MVASAFALMKSALHDTVNRRPVWIALSDLFLDTELTDNELAYIARVLADSPYSISEAETILWREVYPVCIPNMMSIAGEWAGFDEDWLVDAILQESSQKWTLGRFIQPLRWMVRDDWLRIENILVELEIETEGRNP